MKSSVEKCGICDGPINDDELVVWWHGELFHRLCALGYDGPAGRIDGTVGRIGRGSTRRKPTS